MTGTWEAESLRKVMDSGECTPKGCRKCTCHSARTVHRYMYMYMVLGVVNTWRVRWKEGAERPNRQPPYSAYHSKHTHPGTVLYLID